LDITFSQDGLIGLIILLAVIIVILFMIREIRLMKTNTRKLELELERDKLGILKQESTVTAFVEPSLRLSAEQISTLKNIEDTNIALETEIFMKHKTVEGRLRKLENTIKCEKLDLMIDRIESEEKKI